MFTAASLVPSTSLVLCEYVKEERKEGGREKERLSYIKCEGNHSAPKK